MGRNGKNLDEVRALAINDGEEEAVKGNATNADWRDGAVTTRPFARAPSG
jgi:hypothetical protein